MNIRTPVTALAIALGLACAPVIASQASVAKGTTPAPQSSRTAADVTLISTARKVYSFQELDRNHNGMLSRSEIPKDMVNLRRNFTRADFDGNGQLSPQEYVLYSKGLAPQYVGVFHYDTYVNSPANRDLGDLDVTTP